MIGKRLISQRPVTLAFVRETLKERAGEGELTYEQNLTSEYVKKNAKLSLTKAGKLLEELLKVEGVTEELAVKIVDLLPSDLESLHLVLQKDFKLNEDSLKHVLELVKATEK